MYPVARGAEYSVGMPVPGHSGAHLLRACFSA